MNNTITISQIAECKSQIDVIGLCMERISYPQLDDDIRHIYVNDKLFYTGVGNSIPEITRYATILWIITTILHGTNHKNTNKIAEALHTIPFFVGCLYIYKPLAIWYLCKRIKQYVTPDELNKFKQYLENN